MADETTIVTRFEAHTGQAAQEMEKLSQQMSDLAKVMDKQVEGFDRLRSVTDGAVDRLKLFGERGRVMADAINKGITDPTQRAAKAMELFKQESERMAKGEQALKGLDALERKFRDLRMSVDLSFAKLGEFGPILKKGVAGAALAAAAAVAGLAVAIGKKLYDAMVKFIQTAPELQNDLQELKRAADELARSFFNTQRSADLFSGSMREMAVVLRTTRTLLHDNSVAAETFRSTLALLAGPIATVANSLKTFRDALTSVGVKVDQFVSGMFKALTGFSIAELVFGGADIGLAAKQVSSQTSRVLGTFKEFNQEMGKIRRQEFEEAQKFWSQPIQGPKPAPLTPMKMTGPVYGPELPPKEKKGRGRQRKEKKEKRRGLHGQMLAHAKAQHKRRMDQARADYEAAQRRRKSIESILNAEKDTYKRAMEARNKEIQKAQEEARELLAKTADARALTDALGINASVDGLLHLQDVIGQTKDKFVDMGVSMASAALQGVGAMAHGSKSLSEFGDDMATALGGMAAQWGEFFMGVGVGMLLMPGMQVMGAGLIAAGAGLAILGGYLGAVGKGPSATATSSVDAKAMARDILPKEDKRKETYVQVFVAGDQIRDPIWRTMNEGIRTGRVQTMGA